MGAGRAYTIARAVSYTGHGFPTNCAEFAPGRRREFRANETDTPSEVQELAQEHDGATAHTNSHSDTYEHPPEFVCVGPAFVVTGPVTVVSKDGKAPYSSGWLTYESFAYSSRQRREDIRDVVDCSVPYAVAQAEGLPVIKPNTSGGDHVTLNKPSRDSYD